MFLTASTTHIRRYNGVPEGRLNLNFRHASPKGTPKTLAQHEVLGTWHSHSWLCVFPPGWKPLECSPRESQRDAEDFSPVRSAGYNAHTKDRVPQGRRRRIPAHGKEKRWTI